MANIWDTCSYNAEENSEVPFQGVALPRYMVIGCNHPISMVESNQIKPPTKSSLLLQSSIFIISNYIHIYPNGETNGVILGVAENNGTTSDGYDLYHGYMIHNGITTSL